MVQAKFVWHWDRRKEALYRSIIRIIDNERKISKVKQKKSECKESGILNIIVNGIYVEVNKISFEKSSGDTRGINF